MPKHIVDLLTTLGVPADEAAKIDSLPEAEQATFDNKPYIDKVRTNYETQLKNDPAFFNDLTVDRLPPEVKKKMESDSFGRAANIVKDKLLKGLGMSDSDFEDLAPEQKGKIETLIPIIAERWTKNKSGDKQLQTDLIAARKELEKYGPDYEQGIAAKYETASEQKITTAIFNANVIGALSEIPGLKIPASDIAATANTILQSKFGFARIGDYGVELRNKDNKDLKALKPNSSHEMTLKDALIEIATERGWIEKQDEGGKNGSGKITVKPDNSGKLKMVVAPHIQDKVSKKIAAEG